MNGKTKLGVSKRFSIIFILICFLLIGCSFTQIESQESLPGKVILPSQATEDFNLPDVEITIPPIWFLDMDMSSFDSDKYIQENEFKKAVINEDGSMTVTMTKSRQNDLIDEFNNVLTSTFSEMIGSENYPYITGITSNYDYSIIQVDVVRSKYETVIVDAAPLIIVKYTFLYQTIVGLENHTEIIISDASTKEEIKSIIYPVESEQSTEN